MNKKLPVNWSEIRKKVLERDNNKCTICGNIDTLDVHHIHPKYFGGSHELNNLISLCRLCHTNQHIDMQIKLGRKVILKLSSTFKKYLSEYKNSPLYLNDYSPLLKLLTKNTSFREGQEDIINSILLGNDVLVVKPTGGGKSLCFQLPAIMSDKTSLVISPLKALMRDQVKNLQTKGIPVTFLNSDLTREENEARLNFIKKNYFKLFYMAPERFKNLETSDYLENNVDYFGISIKYFIVDEAHCIDKYGQNFREDYGRLNKIKEGYGIPQTIAFTATANPKTRDIIIDKLCLQNPKVIIQGFNRPNIIFHTKVLNTKIRGRHKIYTYNSANVKFKELPLALMNKAKSLIFVRTIPDGENILRKITEHNNQIIHFCKENPRDNCYKILNENKELEIDTIKAELYHSKLNNIEKSNIQDRFSGYIKPQINILICTTAFGMGIDIPDIRYVVHWSQPSNLDDYYQEVGRAGRDGKLSYALLLKTENDESINIKLHEYSIQNINDEARKTGLTVRFNDDLNKMIEFIDHHGCKRKYILDYFGEKYKVDNSFLKRLFNLVRFKKHYCCSVCNKLDSYKKYDKFIKYIAN